MGGDTSREKRKLKRIQAAGKSPAGTSSVPATQINGQTTKKNESPSKKIAYSNTTASGSENDQSGQMSSSNAVLRLRRKLERKAAGKFKLASVEKEKSPPDSTKKLPAIQKRKLGENEHNTFKRQRKNGAKESHSLSDRKKIHAKKKIPTTKHTPKKRDDSKKKKPKHLNRKIAQLSKSIFDGGGNIAELEVQMNKLKEQFEMMKSMKGDTNKSAKSNSEDKTMDVEQNNEVFDKSKHMSEEKTASPSSLPESNEDPSSNEKTRTAPSSQNESSSSSSSSSVDYTSDDEIKEENCRSRGKRRRGRREKAVVEKKNAEVVESNETTNIETDKFQRNEMQGPTEKATTPSKKKTSKKDDNRHCIGRKPVTDYHVGQKYSGKVKYIKSTLGAFIDIGSHSDAFCHISCISDGYAENVEEVVNVGDDVEARVVDVNREKKRITVSLRSDEMAQIEQDKLAAKKKIAIKNEKVSGHTRFDSIEKNSSHSRSTGIGEKHGNHIGNDIFNANSDQKKLEAGAHSSSRAFSSSSSGPKTGADLKRERKLARRAERRAQQMVAE